ncbi:MAG: hypothetical protein GF404_10985 [candidate division Zixibacteria bacterium]|jgi:hypothetical protein|nr:hypothetical protein [candidate division Zixibacteria bacterium]
MENTEADKIAELKKLVDRTAEDIESGDLSEEKARELIAQTRDEAEKLIPEDMDKYDMIYGNRFERLVEQFIKAKKE